MNGKILISKPLYVALAQRKEDRRAKLQVRDFYFSRKTGEPNYLPCRWTSKCLFDFYYSKILLPLQILHTHADFVTDSVSYYAVDLLLKTVVCYESS